ncbi:unnamed protein product [Adineta ricciae]|uniref:Uncharacterized protein n=1 Tax=Adineta ricciae TaxID=249248 RepID=A0A815PC81_ADIRI|nr:unnamed protein product [Adineta ricciae]CAF1657693.1 unnamed protein product [Adineta ricciae]
MSVVQRKCGKCEKTVYPAEEIKCLDKFWHKGCLKCTVCGMTLNVKNVKGYDKMPYCNVHYPQPKPTVVVDNPEMQRIRALTDIQSNAKYHEDFNKSKGKFTAIADNPELTRAKEHQRIVSQAEYTGKRKDSTSQLLASDQPQQSHTINMNTRTYNQSEPAVGRVADYDPINDDRGSLARGYEPTSKAMHAAKYEINHRDVIHMNTKSDNESNGNKHSYNQYEHEQQNPSNNNNNNNNNNQFSHGDGRSAQTKVRALYSYTAAESDEISFNEGDTLIECEQIDDGWMLGRNPKTGQQGLLPSNYVEIIQ